VSRRLAKLGRDPWQDIGRIKQALPAAERGRVRRSRR
jgi:hypothetical protein